MKSNILIKTIILTLIFSKSSFAFNECNKVVNNSSKNIKFLEIVINGERKLLTELGRKLIKFEQIKKAMEIGGYTKALSKYKNFEKKKKIQI